jgi:hypothetical protein
MRDSIKDQIPSDDGSRETDRRPRIPWFLDRSGTYVVTSHVTQDCERWYGGSDGQRRVFSSKIDWNSALLVTNIFV